MSKVIFIVVDGGGNKYKGRLLGAKIVILYDHHKICTHAFVYKRD